ncbi:hypothetical protein VIBNISO65_1780052 [Vibrio nigripulchritudo SO65]|nr:hypothetical protein VIBNIAM115_1480051 [Vibrio nigripulchritudo AM115]CCN43298.1 hypothetical protein VIBNIFTn2_50042 [Vibrio nigripulchritudo FTn2]CCN63744.1 hypothetical protein VIBNIPon4_150075 [Vibrio nigripulchritudo POn4]CCN77069.1 hypothetical protein VIBNISO65_1780052 [Vibrio nigripulchritudo SO65]
MKIHITGNAGSGKTTLASRLGEALDLSVYSLERGMGCGFKRRENAR